MASFLGLILILLGISVIFKIPVFAWLFGALLIYFGITLIGGNWHSRTIRQHSYAHGMAYKTKTDLRFNNRFGEQVIDIADYVNDSDIYTIRSKTSFGSTIIKLDPTIRTRITGSASAGSAITPTGTTSFGSFIYKNYGDNGEPQVIIKAKVAFGTLKIIQY